jgi:hypothetical protein
VPYKDLEANRDKIRAAGNKFARSKKGRKHRKKWRDSHPENIRANTARYRAKMAPEERRANAKRYRDKPATKIKRRLQEAQKRALEEGGFFDPRLIERSLANIPTHCACCGHVFDYNVSGRGCRNYGPSIDRVVNEKWYTLENSRWICGFCNARKSDSTLAIVEMIATYIRQNS